MLILHGTGRGGRRLAQQTASLGSCSGPASRLTRGATSSSSPMPIGGGQSSKPSDGLRAGFPRYTYEDMVAGSSIGC